MRKLLSGLLVLVMLVALLPVTALAAQEAGPVAASAVLENGTVTLTLTAGEETTSGRLTVAYDKELLTYAGLETKGTVTSEEAGGGRRDLRLRRLRQRRPGSRQRGGHGAVYRQERSACHPADGDGGGLQRPGGPPSGAARCACGRAALYGRVRGRLVLRCGGLCVAGGPLPGDG